MTDKIAEIKKKHHELMIEYVNAINQASKLPFLLKISDFRIPFLKKNVPTMLAFRYPIKVFVESHIKAKLNELGDSYIQFAQTFTYDETNIREYSDWLNRAEKESRRFADTLLSLKSIRGIITAFWPWGIILLLTTLNIGDLRNFILKPLFLSLIIIVYVLIMYSTIIIIGAFEYKRHLFYSDSSFLVNQNHHDTNIKNIYRIENKLFNLLEKRKTPEIPISHIFLSLSIFFIASINFINSTSAFSKVGPMLLFCLSIFFLIIGFKQNE